mgnify:CR=1 FL=1
MGGGNRYNLKSIFALSKLAKISLSILSIIALLGIIATYTLNKSIKNETFSSNLILKSQDSRESSGVFAYNLQLDFPKYKPLLRSKSISNVNISRYLWNERVNQNAIQNLQGNNRNLWFESTQDLKALGLENIGVVEYKVDFSPLIWNIIKVFAIVLFLALLISNITKYRLVPFGKSDYLLAFILAAITLILCAGQVDSGHNWGGDFSGYIAQGIALAQGNTAQYIAENTLMMDKCDWLFGPYSYPWGFPALLAIVYKIFGFNLVAFKAVNVLCYAVFVGIFYIFCAKRLARIYAFFATLFFTINPSMISFVANNVLSDISFLLFGFCAIIVLSRLFKAVDCHDSLRESRNSRNIEMGGGQNLCHCRWNLYAFCKSYSYEWLCDFMCINRNARNNLV